MFSRYNDISGDGYERGSRKMFPVTIPSQVGRQLSTSTCRPLPPCHPLSHGLLGAPGFTPAVLAAVRHPSIGVAAIGSQMNSGFGLADVMAENSAEQLLEVDAIS